MKRWPTKPLGEVLEVSTERIEPTEHPDTPFNYVGLESIEGHTGHLLPYQPTPGAKIKSTKNMFHRGEILYGKLRPYLNKVHLASDDGICSTDIYVLRPRQRQIHPSFVANYLRSPSILSVVSNAMAGANLPRINQDALLDIPVPVPSLVEQEWIVKLLDEADELRKLRAQADRRTTKFVPALFDEMFGDPANNPKRWPIVPAGDLMVLCEYGCSQKANEDSEGIPMLRMGNVTSAGLLDLTDLKHVLFGKDELLKYRLASGDVLFNRTNSRELVGKTGMWDGRFEAVAASYFIRIRLDPTREHPQHFTTFMNLPHMKQRLMEMARGAIGQSNINAQELKAIPVPVPPLPLQKEFAQRVRQIRELESAQAQTRARLDDLFASVLDKAFKGKL
jgi:type I restriction enzyme S subunit